jgi:cytidine kinase
LAGYLAKAGEEIGFAALRRAVVHGSVLASYNVEAFSLERLKTVNHAQIAERFDIFYRLSQFDAG